MSAIRILVSDSTDRRTQVWIRAFSQENIEVQGSDQLTDILMLLERVNADLLLVNVDTFDLERQGALLAIRDSFPQLRIIGLSDASPNLARQQAFRFCVDKVLTRPISPERVITLFPPLMHRYLCRRIPVKF